LLRHLGMENDLESAKARTPWVCGCQMSNPIGFHSVGLHRYDIEKVIEKVAQAGYQALELNAEQLPWAEPHVTPELPAEMQKRICNLARDMGIMLSAVSAHVALLDNGLEKQKANLNYALGCIGLAAEMEIPVAHLISGARLKKLSYHEAFKQLADQVYYCVEHGRRIGVKVAIEPVVNHLVCNRNSLLALMEAIKPAELFVNFDPSHLWVHGDDVPATVGVLGSHIVHVHVKDAKGGPENFQFPPLGLGCGDFEGLAKSLRAVGYQGVLSIEYEANAFGYRKTEAEILEGSLLFVKRMML
jgi:sugar phosphate isomerase/epimerase